MSFTAMLTNILAMACLALPLLSAAGITVHGARSACSFQIAYDDDVEKH